MNPSELSKYLQKIASKLDNSEKPDKKAVLRDLQSAVRYASGADSTLVKYLLAEDSREPVIHALIQAFNEVDGIFLKEEGYNSVSSLELDESEKAQTVKALYYKLAQQTEVIVNALRSILPEVANLDKEIQEA